jgi:hypothetical protein
MIELVVCHVYFSVHSLSLSVLFSLCVAAVGEVEVDTRAVAVATRARARAWLRRPGLLTSPQCNRTDQIIRAQVQKQAPKRSNFRT